MASKIDWSIRNQIERNCGQTLMAGEVATLTDEEIATYNTIQQRMLEESEILAKLTSTAQERFINRLSRRW